ncbi:MAG TPA: SDR family NAD(P)-dependent oxidoreductase [Ramlibacter sp.]|jgi:NAD(P)-dependent dehydrogenase (short-subunit alcohol dehydrogenase family)|nr:SDR family NAD(P)-dependent oxidoreductase [Ramlibacter sp.]
MEVPAAAGPVNAALAAGSLFDVHDRVYAVTGAASGLGRAMAAVLAANGARLVLLDMDADRLHTVAHALAADGAAAPRVCVVDVADTAAVQGALHEAIDACGRIDGLFANAGISAGPGFGASPAGELQAIPPDTWDRVLAVNLTAGIGAMQAVVPAMKRQGHGRIVLTASIAGVRAEPFCGYAYAASKAAVINVMRQAAVELAPHGILVNAIAPGFIHTAIGGGRLDDAAVRDQLAARVPLGRVGQPHELSGLALLLASDAGSYITGTLIPVDGGVLAA